MRFTVEMERRYVFELEVEAEDADAAAEEARNRAEGEHTNTCHITDKVLNVTRPNEEA